MRRFTVAEANALVPRLSEVVPRLRESYHAWKFAREQIEDLETMWAGAGRIKLEDPENPDRSEWLSLLREAGASERGMKDALAALEQLGVELKDPTIGLVDFPAERRGETVFLCWRDGEREIVAWHDLAGGYAGRRPLAEF